MLGAVLANALSSLGNLVITVAVARSVDAATFGWYALALVFVALSVGVLRSAILESVLARPAGQQMMFGHIVELLVPSAVLCLVSAALGIIIGRTEFLMVGLGLPGLSVFDYLRNALIVNRRSVFALAMEGAWTAATVAGIVLFEISVCKVSVAFGIWCLAPTAIAWVAWTRLGRPKIATGTDRAFSPLFALDYLVGAGSSQLATAVLGMVSSATVVGAIRAGATLFSPVNLITNAIRPILIARIAAGEASVVRSLRMASSMAAVTAVIACVALIIPDGVGVQLLGASWDAAASVRLPLALEAILGFFAGVAFAGQRALAPAAQILATRGILGVVRVGLVLVGVAIFGLLGAAWALPLVTGLGCGVWWFGYWRADRSARRSTSERCDGG